MPRYYLHVCDGLGFCEDAEGYDLPDDEAARSEAIRSARSLMAEELQKGELNLAFFIEVENEERQHLFTVTFGETVTVRHAD